MSEKIEIERKFLVEMPDFEKINIIKRIEILQTYLHSNSDSQRRVRRITENNNIRFFYTKKIFISPVIRNENESEINAEKYNELLKEARNDCPPISKTRVVFDYMEQQFELDIYPFSEKSAILELELENPSQEIHFPDYINVIKEVSDDGRYSNAALSKAGTFPAEISTEGDC